LLLDENIAQSTITLCRTLGFDVKSVKEEGWDGKDDAELLQLASAENRVILTLDKDFGNLLRFPFQTHRGVILIRLHAVKQNQLDGVVDSPIIQSAKSRSIGALPR